MTTLKSRSAVALLAGTMLFALPAEAQTDEGSRQRFDLSEQDLGDALRSVAAQAGVELYSSAEDIAGLKAEPLKGEYTTYDAISQLLRGTGLRASFDGHSVIIRRRASNQVNGASAREPVIVVTGTRIEGAPPTVPVTTVTSEDIRNAGQNDLGEVARSLPQNFGGGQNPGIGNSQGAGNENVNANGASTFNLRGIGPNATLTLINGNRFAYSSVNSVIDVSAIPVAAVDRVEIVADGASAIYGADAVAGVANIILKHDYSGVSTSARIGASTDGGNVQKQINILGGSSWSNGGILAAYDYSHNSTIKAGDRSYAGANNVDSTLFPAIRRHAFLFSGHQALGATVKLSADLIYKRGTMSSATGYALNQPVTALGLTSRTNFKTFGIAPTLAVDLFADWDLKLSGFFGTDVTDGLSKNYSGGALVRTTARHYFNRNLAAEAGLEGTLFDLPAGSARLAFGGGWRASRFRSEIGTRAISRRRENIFAYGELYLPLANPAQTLSIAHSASLTAAMRFEDYSDSGSIVTPKIGFVYEPVKQLRLGISWGRSFKLPTLFQQYSGYVALLVPVGGFGQGYPPGSSVAYALGPNDQLGPERSENWTLSATVKPVRDLELSASYFRIDYRDRVAPPLASGAGVLDNPVYAPLVTFNPGVPLLADIISGAAGGLQNITGQPYDPAQVVAFLDARDRNVAAQKYRGVDLSARYRIALAGKSELLLTAAGTWLDSSQILLPGLPTTELAGTIFHPPHFRARGGVTFSGKRGSVSSFLSYSGGVTDNRRSMRVELSSQMIWDMTARIRVGDNSEIAVSALNILNSKPDPIFTNSPFDTPIDSTNYSAAGRFVGLTIRHDW